MISHVSVCLLAHREKAQFQTLSDTQNGSTAFGSSDWLYSRFFFLIKLFEQGYKLYLS